MKTKQNNTHTSNIKNKHKKLAVAKTNYKTLVSHFFTTSVQEMERAYYYTPNKYIGRDLQEDANCSAPVVKMEKLTSSSRLVASRSIERNLTRRKISSSVSHTRPSTVSPRHIVIVRRTQLHQVTVTVTLHVHQQFHLRT